MKNNKKKKEQQKEEVVAVVELSSEEIVESVAVDPEVLLEGLAVAEEPTETVESGESAAESVLELSEQEAAPRPEGLIFDAGEITQAAEALIFASPKPLSLQRMKRLLQSMNFEVENLKSLLDDLIVQYENKGIQLVRVGQAYQFRTHRKQNDVVQKIVEEKPARLSKSALEVLAIVSYKQPVTRADLDAVRGIDSGHLLRGLLEKNLIKMEGHAELPGRPMLYATTPYFLEVFSLNSLDDLPSLEEFTRELNAATGETDALLLAADPGFSPLAANPDRGDFEDIAAAEERFETPMLETDIPVQPEAEA
jgi:segregation and condensation protein B